MGNQRISRWLEMDENRLLYGVIQAVSMNGIRRILGPPINCFVRRFVYIVKSV